MAGRSILRNMPSWNTGLGCQRPTCHLNLNILVYIISRLTISPFYHRSCNNSASKLRASYRGPNWSLWWIIERFSLIVCLICNTCTELLNLEPWHLLITQTIIICWSVLSDHWSDQWSPSVWLAVSEPILYDFFSQLSINTTAIHYFKEQQILILIDFVLVIFSMQSMGVVFYAVAFAVAVNKKNKK